MVRVRRALISVSDKSGLLDFARALQEQGAELISTGGTARALTDAGIPVTPIDQVTGFPEMMEGRVKTLHPAVHGGLLADRMKPDHMDAIASMGISPIDLVCVNLYPFEATVSRPGVDLAEAIENIDIGGPSMVRSAAKNHSGVVVVVDPNDYGTLMEEIRNSGGVCLETRQRLAAKAFSHTAFYDAQIGAFLRTRFLPAEPFPAEMAIPLRLAQPLRYGENPHQMAASYKLPNVTEPCVSRAEPLGGKELSYNNLLDADAALEMVKEWTSDRPCCVIVKHTNPCGIAIRDTLPHAIETARAADAVSAFGGIMALNRVVDEESARAITGPNTFLEVLLAPDYTPEALHLLKTRKKWGANLRILRTGPLAQAASGVAFRSIVGGALLQDRDLHQLDPSALRVMTRREPTQAEMEQLLFAWKCVKHVKSNAIVFANQYVLVGTGAGQMNRVQSVRLAAEHAGEHAVGAVMASDAFFPFPDGVEAAAAAGVTAVIQPGGSVKDSEVIEAADRLNLAMVATGVRHFRH